MSDSLRKWVEMQYGKEWTMDSSYTNNETPPDPIVMRVISIMKERSRKGIDKYGTTLYDSPDGFYEFLNHLQEEMFDAILYIEKLKSQK